MNGPRVLVAGIGNIFLGDDAFGCEVVRRMLTRPQPDGVRVVDFGIRGLDLAYALLDGYDAAVLVDAMPRGEPPGTLFVIEPEPPDPADPAAPGLAVQTHSLDPVKVLRLAAALGSPVRRLLVVGCQPAPPGDVEEMSSGLSEPVRAAVEEAVRLVESLVAELVAGTAACHESERP
jgi:hydrogenase maturation protease